MDRAEGLLPLRGNGIEGRNAGEVLHRIGHLHRLSLGGVHGLDPVPAEGADGGLHPRFYDKHNLMEPGPHRVIDRILHNGLAVGLPAVGQVEDFLSLVENYVYYPTDTLSLDEGTKPQIAVLHCSV